MLLSERDRNTFIAWLKQDITSNEGIVRQLEKIGAAVEMSKMYKAEITACQIVLKKLQDVDKVSVGG